MTNHLWRAHSAVTPASGWTDVTKTLAAISATALLLSLISVGFLVRNYLTERHRGAIRRELAKQLAICADLLTEVSQGDPQRDFHDLSVKIQKWTDETVAVLHKLGAENEPLFRSNPVMALHATQYQDQSTLRNFLLAREARLAEIIGRW